MAEAIQHDEAARKFYVRLGGYEAFLMYAKQGEVLDFYHTYVPEAQRNRGLADRIVKHGFEYAKARRFKVKPTCSYIAEFFVPRHPEYQSLLESKAGRS